jgi:hypothetical protein
MSTNDRRVIPFRRPRLGSAAEFDRLTVQLVLAKYRAGTLPEPIIVALLAGAGVRT